MLLRSFARRCASGGEMPAKAPIVVAIHSTDREHVVVGACVQVER
jgi:hypothetical protein